MLSKIILCFINFLFLLSLWFRDIIRESTILCKHTRQVENFEEEIASLKSRFRKEKESLEAEL